MMPQSKKVTTAVVNAVVEGAMRQEFERGKQLAIDLAERIIGWTTRVPEPMTMAELRAYLGQEIARVRNAR